MLEKELVDSAVVRLIRVARDLEVPPEEPDTEKMALHLFAVTRSASNVLEEKGFTVFTLDSDPKYGRHPGGFPHLGLSAIPRRIFQVDYRGPPLHRS